MMAKYKNKGPPVRPHKSKCRGCRFESSDSETCLAAFCIYMMARSLICCPQSAGLLPWHGLKRWERYRLCGTVLSMSIRYRRILTTI